MRSAYVKSKSDLRKIAVDEAQKELEKFRAENCDRCSTNMGYQCIATVLWVLHRDYGWGTVRLNRLKDSIEDEFRLMEMCMQNLSGFAKTDYTGNDLVKALKELEIDVEKSQYAQ